MVDAPNALEPNELAAGVVVEADPPKGLAAGVVVPNGLGAGVIAAADAPNGLAPPLVLPPPKALPPPNENSVFFAPASLFTVAFGAAVPNGDAVGALAGAVGPKLNENPGFVSAGLASAGLVSAVFGAAAPKALVPLLPNVLVLPPNALVLPPNADAGAFDASAAGAAGFAPILKLKLGFGVSAAA